jgi:hypothetical protein
MRVERKLKIGSLIVIILSALVSLFKLLKNYQVDINLLNSEQTKIYK